MIKPKQSSRVITVEYLSKLAEKQGVKRAIFPNLKLIKSNAKRGSNV